MVPKPQIIPSFISPERKGFFVRCLLVLYIIVTGLNVIVDAAEISVLGQMQQGIRPSHEYVVGLDNLHAVFVYVEMIAYVAAGISMWIWIINTRRNLLAMDTAGLQYNEVDAAGAFIIPIYNLYKPFQAMQETWRASDPEVLLGEEWKYTPGSTIIKTWWTLWIISSLLGYGLGLGRVGATKGIESILAAFQAAECSHVMMIATSVMAMIAVAQITRRQDSKYANWQSALAQNPGQ